MTILPAVPAGRLAPVGHAIPAREIREQLDVVAVTDPEEARRIENEVVLDILDAVRDGHPDPLGCLMAALVVLGADDAAAIRQLMDQYPDGAERLWRAMQEEGDTDE